MAGYQTIEALRPILHRGPVPTPVVDRALVGRVDPPSRPATVLTGGKLRLAPSVIAEIIARRERGESQRAIADALGTNRTTVSKYAGHVGAPEGGWKVGKREPIVRNRAFAERLRRAGFSYEEIAAELGCCYSQAYYLFNKRTYPSGSDSPVSLMVQLVSRETGVPCANLRRTATCGGGRQPGRASRARHILFWLIRKHLPSLSLPEIGKELGGFDHSSVLHGVNRCQSAVLAHGLSPRSKPRRIVRALWAAEWPAPAARERRR